MGRCAHQFNGMSLIWLHKSPEVDSVMATDACLVGYGGTFGQEYFRGRFPGHLKGSNIVHLEILAVMVTLKLWGNSLKGRYFWIHVDNEAVAAVINTGASRDTQLQDVLREIVLLAAKNEFVIKARHIAGNSNRIPDWLFRWHDVGARRAFKLHARESSLKQVKVSTSLLQLDNQW